MNLAKPDNQNELPVLRAYEVMAYLSLAIVFVAHLMHERLLGGVLALGGGALLVYGQVQRGPILFLVLVMGNQLVVHGHGLQVRNDFRLAWLDLNDVLMCAGVLGYVAAHYRLQGIWHSYLAPDKRRRVPKRDRRKPGDLVDAQKRTPRHVTRQEVSLLIISLPIWVLLAQVSADRLARSSERLLDISPWLVRILIVVWVLGIGTFVIVNLFDAWKRRGMSRAAAWIFLQDTVWHETRGEQRSLQRWLAWARLRGKKQS